MIYILWTFQTFCGIILWGDEMTDNTLFEKFTDIRSDDIRMYYCGKRVETENHIYGPEIRDHFLIVLVESGRAVLYRGNDETEFGRKDMLVIFPGEKIFYSAKSKWSIKWVGINGNNIEEKFKRLGLTRENPIFRAEEYEKISEIFSQIYNTAESNSVYSSFKIQSLLYDFFAELFKERRVKNGDVTEAAIRIMEYNYMNSLTVRDISDKFFLDNAYFSRLFKSKTGVTPKKYILKLRIERASELLKTTEDKVKDIPKTVGFEDSLYFSRIFLKMTGLTPTEYRKKSREN